MFLCMYLFVCLYYYFVTIKNILRYLILYFRYMMIMKIGLFPNSNDLSHFFTELELALTFLLKVFEIMEK